MITNSTWVDTHCHLEMLKTSTAEAMAHAREMGVGLMMTIGTKDSSNKEVLRLIHEYEEVYGAVGIHPHEADQATQAHLDFIASSLKAEKKLVALGECGFDLYYEHSTIENQKRVFYQQIEIALEQDIPLVIHSREAEPATRQMLQDFKGRGLKGVFHSYTSSPELAKEILDLGFYVSVNGICTFPKSEEVREVLRMIPKDQLLLETDSPFLAPVPVRGKSNLPGNVAHVGRFVAETLGRTPEEVQEQCFRNCRTLFERLSK